MVIQEAKKGYSAIFYNLRNINFSYAKQTEQRITHSGILAPSVPTFLGLYLRVLAIQVSRHQEGQVFQEPKLHK